MTRINVVPVSQLSGPHLVSEYRELPRVFGLAHKASMSPKPWTHKQPNRYTMGQGHIYFFVDKLMFLADRHKAIIAEMLLRGFKPAYTACLHEQWQDRIPASYWKAYRPDSEALEVNQQRIAERNSAIDERNKGK